MVKLTFYLTIDSKFKITDNDLSKLYEYAWYLEGGPSTAMVADSNWTGMSSDEVGGSSLAVEVLEEAAVDREMVGLNGYLMKVMEPKEGE